MPKFTRYGPVVPDALVQGLEDDKVVIFCGAGISMGAGLPDFNGLVKHCYEALHVDPPKSKRSEWTWPDRLLGALETQCSATELRRVVASRLSEPPKTLDLHKAILRLARLTRTRGIRLVTTNFDTYFEQAQDDLVFGQHLHSGPVLPIPRNDRIASWRSVAYLHGRLANDGENDHLVLTSADFGRAYLTEAWAARFVARLFVEFTVLFIGYSLNDPVLRYMTDAIAADRRLAVGNDHPSAYIFVGHKGPAEPEKRLFRDHGLEPIFYNQERHHLRLKQTLIAWAQAREDFFLSAKTIVEHAAGSRPQALDPSEADNLLWAVLDRPNDGGHGARIFAGIETTPPIEWLMEFERHEKTLSNNWAKAEQEARKADKPVPPEPILHLHQLTPPRETEPFFVTQTSDALIRWLVRHVGTIELVVWIIDKFDTGRHLHARLRRAIRERLASEHSLAPGFELFWRIVSAEGLWNQPALPRDAWHDFVQQLPTAAHEPWLWQELQALFRPHLHLAKAYYREWRAAITSEAGNAEPIGESFRTVADATVWLEAHDQINLIVQSIDRLPNPADFLAMLADPMSELLEEALNLYAVVGQANSDGDPSIIARPSVVPHAQNHAFQEWTILFDLLWRAWRHLDATAPDQARALVRRWRERPYFAFKRLVLAAMTASDNFAPEEKLELLISV